MFEVRNTVEVIVKARLLLAGAFFLLAQVSAPHAQVTVDVAKVTCRQFLTDQFAPSRYVEMWLSGYYNGKRNNTIIEPGAMEEKAQKVSQYCFENPDTTVMDAVKNVLGFDK
jgi:acid stress chaperone HdeB